MSTHPHRRFAVAACTLLLASAPPVRAQKDVAFPPDVYAGRWFRDAEQLKQFKAEGALLVHGRKP